MLNRVYLSLGSNVGNREQNLRAAINQLKTLGTILEVSSLYETEPVEFTAQPWFLNCVIALEIGRSPHALLDALLTLEQAMGRQRTRRKGPRTIDLDILLYGNEIVNAPGLVIPHPALPERRFVLEPLAEIAPDVVHPVVGKTIQQLRDELPAGQLVRRFGSAATHEADQ